MKRLAILLVAALFVAQSPAMAAPKVAAGATCSKVGLTQVVSGKKFTCIKSGKKTVWDKGVAAKKSQTITADAVADVEISEESISASVKASSGLTVQATSSTPLVCQVDSALAVALKKIGKCTLTFTQPGNASFNAALPVTLSFNITKIAQEISTGDEAEIEFLEKTQTITWEASSGLEVKLTSSTPSTCTVQGDTLTLLALGSCEIQGNQAGNEEYLPAAAYSFKYQIIKPKQEIDFTQIDNVSVEEEYVDLEASSDAADENITLIFTTSTPSVCVIEEDRLRLVAPGDCTVLANHPGTAIFGPAPEASQTFKVLPARVGSSSNPVAPGVAIKSEASEITFISYTEKVDMANICRKNADIEGCTQDKNSRGIPDPDAETKIVGLLFEYKNLGTDAIEVELYFSAVFEEEFIDADPSVVPTDLIGKRVLANASEKGYVYISVPDYFEMKDVLLYFEAFDVDSNDVYIAVG
jgi:hypothetical protein